MTAKQPTHNADNCRMLATVIEIADQSKMFNHWTTVNSETGINENLHTWNTLCNTAIAEPEFINSAHALTIQANTAGWALILGAATADGIRQHMSENDFPTWAQQKAKEWLGLDDNQFTNILLRHDPTYVIASHLRHLAQHGTIWA